MSNSSQSCMIFVICNSTSYLPKKQPIVTSYHDWTFMHNLITVKL
jgi:hypothetical protein